MTVPSVLQARLGASLDAAPEMRRPSAGFRSPIEPAKVPSQQSAKPESRDEPLTEWVPNGNVLPVPSPRVYSWGEMSVELTDVFLCLLLDKYMASDNRLIPRRVLELMFRAGSRAPELGDDRTRWQALLEQIERDDRELIDPLSA